MTRHKDNGELFWSKETFPKYDDMAKNLSRIREKDSTLDYIDEKSFAYHRGLHQTEIANYKPSKEFSDLFTPEMLNNINHSKNDIYKDLFGSERNEFNKQNLGKSKGDNEIDL